MRIESWAIDRPIPYAKNPRKNKAAVAKVKASLAEFGFRQPIVVDEKGVVVVGHTRLLAARELGITEVPVHVAEGLTAAQIQAYRIADNRTNELAEWDNDLLAQEINELMQAGDIDVGVTGFDSADLAAILAQVSEIEFAGLPDGDKPPFEQMTFTLSNDQADVVRQALVLAKKAGPLLANGNSNGNALARVAELALATLR